MSSGWRKDNYFSHSSLVCVDEHSGVYIQYEVVHVALHLYLYFKQDKVWDHIFEPDDNNSTVADTLHNTPYSICTLQQLFSS